MGICHYCKKEKKLIKAHIIPKAFFKQIKSEPSVSLFSFSKETFKKRIPKGLYDKEILCEACDNELGKYDQYGFNLLIKKDISPYKSKKIWYIPNSEYEYLKVKKFFVSVLWRASISSLSEYSDVSLGEKYTRLALAYIKGELDDSENLFPCFLKKYAPLKIRGDEQAFDLVFMLSPRRLADKKEHKTYYAFCICGYEIWIKVGNKIETEPWKHVFLNNKIMYIIEEDFRKNYYFKEVSDIVENQL